MKKIILSVSFLVSCFCIAQAQVEFGGGLQFYKPSGGSSIGIGAEALVNLNEEFDLNPSFHYYFEDVTIYAIDADVHYKKLVLNDKVKLNPFAGLNVLKISSLDAELGINLGVHIQSPINDSFTLYVEPKLILISDADGFALGAGILF